MHTELNTELNLVDYAVTIVEGGQTRPRTYVEPTFNAARALADALAKGCTPGGFVYVVACSDPFGDELYRAYP